MISACVTEYFFGTSTERWTCVPPKPILANLNQYFSSFLKPLSHACWLDSFLKTFFLLCDTNMNITQLFLVSFLSFRYLLVLPLPKSFRFITNQLRGLFGCGFSRITIRIYTWMCIQKKCLALICGSRPRSIPARLVNYLILGFQLA